MNLLHRKGVASAALAASCLWMSLGVATAQMPDNTANNKGDTQTADKQSNAKADRDITAKVRKEIVGDKDLSTYAHNVKVITNEWRGDAEGAGEVGGREGEGGGAGGECGFGRQDHERVDRLSRTGKEPLCTLGSSSKSVSC